MYSGGDEGNIVIATYLLVSILHDDETIAAPHEGDVNSGGTHNRIVVGFKVLRDKALRLGLAHGYIAPKFDPDVADLVTRALVESESDATDVGGSGLAGTLGETPLDDLLEARQVFGLVFSVNNDLGLCRGSSH